MSAEGIFHDAHEVNVKVGDEWKWVATFATKRMADNYALEYKRQGNFYATKVVPV